MREYETPQCFEDLVDLCTRIVSEYVKGVPTTSKQRSDAMRKFSESLMTSYNCTKCCPNRLRDYEEARKNGGWGWREKYNQQVANAFSKDLKDKYPYLTGWYEGMLDEALDELNLTRAMLSQDFVIRIEKV